MLDFGDFQVCTNPSEYSLIRELSTGKLFRLRAFHELPVGFVMVYSYKDGCLPQAYWGYKRWEPC